MEDRQEATWIRDYISKCKTMNGHDLDLYLSELKESRLQEERVKVEKYKELFNSILSLLEIGEGDTENINKIRKIFNVHGKSWMVANNYDIDERSDIIELLSSYIKGYINSESKSPDKDTSRMPDVKKKTLVLAVSTPTMRLNVHTKSTVDVPVRKYAKHLVYPLETNGLCISNGQLKEPVEREKKNKRINAISPMILAEESGIRSSLESVHPDHLSSDKDQSMRDQHIQQINRSPHISCGNLPSSGNLTSESPNISEMRPHIFAQKKHSHTIDKMSKSSTYGVEPSDVIQSLTSSEKKPRRFNRSVDIHPIPSEKIIPRRPIISGISTSTPPKKPRVFRPNPVDPHGRDIEGYTEAQRLSGNLPKRSFKKRTNKSEGKERKKEVVPIQVTQVNNPTLMEEVWTEDNELELLDMMEEKRNADIGCWSKVEENELQEMLMLKLRLSVRI